MNEQYFFVRKLGLGKEVVSQPRCNEGISGKWNEMMKTGGWFANILKIRILKGCLRHLVSSDSS